MQMRATIMLVLLATPAASAWPRLTERGFAGMTPLAMAKQRELERKFPGLVVERHEPPQYVLTWNGSAVMHVYFEKVAEKLVIDEPGIVTEHGLEVGKSLAAVLDLRHRCETLRSVIDSTAQVHVAIRCWVGRKPAHFRYIAHIDGDTPPDEAAALEQWIRKVQPPITAIWWNLKPAPYEN